MLKADFFTGNRERLMQALPGGLVVLTAYGEVQRSGDMAAFFEQEANFWYLTGIEKPDWELILDGQSGKSWLVAPPADETQTLFDGSLDAKTAAALSGIETVVTHEEGQTLIRDLMAQHGVVYTAYPLEFLSRYTFALNPRPAQLIERLKRLTGEVRDCQPELISLRAIKQPAEIKAIQQAVNLTVDGFKAVKKDLNSFHAEYQIEAEFDYLFKRHQGYHAYDPIVATGKNACTLHYTDNDSRLKKGQLVLIDIGARLHGYAADVTRTYAFGEPNKRAGAVHAAVQQAQAAIIGLLEPNRRVDDYLHRVDLIMQDALRSLDLPPEKVRRYFPHAISHGLGLDVHDSLDRPQIFQSGMVLTVEPGIYIPEEGIGVRIEDDILITENGRTNLSGKLSTAL